MLAVQRWAEAEQSAGHSLARADLLRQFRRCLSQAVEQLQGREGSQSEAEQAALAHFLQKEKGLADCRRKRLRQSAYLVAKTGFVERETNRQTKLSQEEEDRRLLRHWQIWDHLLWLAGCAPAGELADWVAKPEQFVENRAQTVLSFSDQIPVWLRPGAGKLLQSRRLQQKAADCSKQRRAARRSQQQQEQLAEQPEVPELDCPHSHVRGPGDSQSERPGAGGREGERQGALREAGHGPESQA